MINTTKRLFLPAIVLSILALVAVPVYAKDSMVALDGNAVHENAQRSVVQARDAYHHEPVSLDFGEKTLGTARPGDIVKINGEDHQLTSMTHELHDSEVRPWGFYVGAVLKFKQHGVDIIPRIRPGHHDDP